jgi:putative aldouronate transport system permease protein
MKELTSVVRKRDARKPAFLTPTALQREGHQWAVSFRRYKYLYLLVLPALAYYIIFQYVPLYGLVVAFKEYRVSEGMLGSSFADPLFRHFGRLFRNSEFWRAVGNTFIINIYRVVFSFPAPLVLALILNEIRNMQFRKVVQTVIYLPHFISWVVIGGILIHLLAVPSGPINVMISALGITPRRFMTDSATFRGLLVLTAIWKTAGWGTIIYLAALAGVDVELYDAARIDGAKRLRVLISVTLPQIMSTVAVLFILNLGQIMNLGFEQVFILYSVQVYDVADIIDTYVYRVGIMNMQYSFATAAGLFKSVIGFTFLVSANAITKRLGERGIF